MSEKQQWTGRVERLGWGGLGLARDGEGRLILLRAPLALFSGEVVEAELTPHPRHSEGYVQRWVESDPGRETPRCPVAQRCGGCDLWGAPRFGAELKLEMARDLLKRQLSAAPELEWQPAPDWARRQRIQLHWDGERLGYYERGSKRLVAVSACPMADDPLSAALAPLLAALRSGGLPGYPARWEIAGSTPADEVKVWQTDGEEASRAWRLASGRWRSDDSPLEHRLGGGVLLQPPGTFFQSCPAWAWEAFSGLLQEWRLSGQTLFDLFSGVGFFSAMLAQAFKRFVLVEANGLALAAARINLRGMQAEFYEAPLEAWMRPELGSAEDVLLLDPPRAGLEKSTVGALLSAGAGSILLIGCDGAAFCRDVQRLSAGWKLQRLAALDLFPNTVQLEFVALLKRAS